MELSPFRVYSYGHNLTSRIFRCFVDRWVKRGTDSPTRTSVPSFFASKWYVTDLITGYEKGGRSLK